jgi:hypothetical protein
MFDPSILTPPANYVDYIENNKHHNLFQAATFWAQWGAAQALEALKLQMPTDGIRDRPPTEEDGDKEGWVQVLRDGRWWDKPWDKAYGPWLHTPSWRPTPPPKEQALALLRGASDQFTDEELALLLKVVKSAPENIEDAHVKTTPATPLTIGNHVVKPGDTLTLRNNKAITVHQVVWDDDLWQVSYRVQPLSERLGFVSVYANGINPYNGECDILGVEWG